MVWSKWLISWKSTDFLSSNVVFFIFVMLKKALILILIFFSVRKSVDSMHIEIQSRYLNLLDRHTDISMYLWYERIYLLLMLMRPTFHDNFHVLADNAKHGVTGDIFGDDILLGPSSASKLVKILTGIRCGIEGI